MKRKPLAFNSARVKTPTCYLKIGDSNCDFFRNSQKIVRKSDGQTLWNLEKNRNTRAVADFRVVYKFYIFYGSIGFFDSNFNSTL